MKLLTALFVFDIQSTVHCDVFI